jgi:TonB-linked SusC/RagA family outer membrane protein
MNNYIIIYKKLVLVILSTFLICITSFAQEKIVGKVIDTKDGSPIAGATLFYTHLNSSGRTVTDNKGDFKFDIVKFGDILNLQVSLLGYLKKDTILNLDVKQLNDLLLISLKQSNTQLETVNITVSTGYQNLPKERSTGSFTYIDNKKFNEQVSTDVISRLESTANGLMFDRGTGSTPRLSIRGLSTLQGSMTEPLIVLDNFPYEGSLNNINPNDVEGITILKDAAAASIWGAKAANGVIVITTKKGKLNQSLTIDFASNASLTDKPNLFSIKSMSSSDFIDVEQMLFSRGYYTGQINSINKPALSPVIELLIRRSTASQSDVAVIDNEIASLRNFDVRNDFNKYIYERGLKQQYSLNMRGGSNVMSWNLSFGYDQSSDNLNAEYNRRNIRFQNNILLTKDLTISSDLTLTLSESNSGKSGYGEIVSKSGGLYPYAQLADNNGKSLPIVKDWRYEYIKNAGNGKLLDWKYYPLEDYKSLNQTNTLSDILVNLGANYKFLNALQVDIKYQFERQGSSIQNFQGLDSYYTRNLINGYTQIGSNGEVLYKVPLGAIVDNTDAIMQSHNLRGQLNLDKTLGKHSVNAILGSEFREANPISHSNRVYGFDENTLTSGTVDYTVQYPNFITGTRSFINNGIYSSDRTTRFVSFYGNAAYTYNSRYTISASARRDASNLFGFKTNDRWNPLWSTGLSWGISEEDFYKKTLLSNYLPYLKLRITYGYSGNIHPSLASATTIQYYGNSAYTLLPYARFENYANPQLKWETTGMLNLGVDFRSKNNRINGSIEYYDKRSSDLFANVPIDYTGGIGTTAIKNVAKMKGKGFDINLNSLNVDEKFRWSTDLNFSTNKDRVTDYYLASERGSNFLNVIPSRTGLVGKPVFSIFSYQWAGLDPTIGAARGYYKGEVSSNYLDITGTGTTANDLVYHGSAIPTIFGSVGNTFSWKGLSASIRFVYKFNYYFRKETISYNALYTNWTGHSDYDLRWQKAGDEKLTNVPSLTYPASTQAEAFYRFAEPFVLKGDHVRLQYVNISYQLNKSPLNKLPVKSLQIFLNASNLGIIWRENKEHLDPDYSYNSSMLTPSRTYSIGIRTTL